MGWLDRFKRRTPVNHSSPPGRGPLDERLASVYGRQLPFHDGASIAFADGGPDPLDGISIYWNAEGPHGHYVGFGLADVGIELTFRLAARRADVGTEPARFLGSIAYNAPPWPISMLNMLARRVRRTGRPFGHGHYWQGQDGILRPHSGLTCLAFARDPTLGTVAAPTGSVTFLQAVAVTPSTLASMKDDETHRRGNATLDALLTTGLAPNSLLVTRADDFP